MSQNVSTKQYKAIIALLNGSTFTDAAAAAGVSRKTVERWRDDEAFFSELQRLSDHTLKDATRRLVATLDTAIDVLQDAMQNPDKPHQRIRLRAANYALSHAPKFMELSDIIQRIEVLENEFKRSH